MTDANILCGANFKSPTFEKELEETSLDEYLIAAAKRRSNETAVIDASSSEKLLLKDFLKKSYNLAAELQALGCGKDTIVGLVSENRLEFPIAVLGTMLTGAVITCFNPDYTTDELKPLYNIAKPTIVFCSPQSYNQVKEVVPSCTSVIVFDSVETLEGLPYLKFSLLTQSGKNIQTKVKNKPDDVVFTLYSSGTTGLPKGVMLTHRNVVFIMKVIVDEQLIETRGSAALNVGPMFHGYGLHNFFSAIARDQTLIIIPKYEDRLYLSTIEEYKVKFLALVPPLVMFLLKDPKVDGYDLSSVEAVICGSAPLKPETEQAFKDKFRLQYVQQGYGLTETVLSTALKDPRNTKSGTCGSVIPGVRIKIIDPQTGRILGKNERGEICIKGPQIMKGYYGNAKATAETIDNEGWLHTGDIGYYDDDTDLFIVDRAKELIKCGHVEVAPAELEALLLTHAAVADSGVIGIPDEVSGEIPRAYVVKQIGVEVTAEEIIQYVAGKVSPPKRLTGGVEFVAEIPRNPSGKIVRKVLRELWTVKCKPKA